jgi:hypothetical protein
MSDTLKTVTERYNNHQVELIGYNTIQSGPLKFYHKRIMMDLKGNIYVQVGLQEGFRYADVDWRNVENQDLGEHTVLPPGGIFLSLPVACIIYDELG